MSFHQVGPPSMGTETCLRFHTHIHSACSQKSDFIALFGNQSPLLVCCILLFKHTSPMRCKGKKITNWHIWQTGSLVYPMAVLLKGEMFCTCVLFVSVWIGVDVYTLLILNVKSDFSLNIPLIFKIRHMVTKYVSKQ